MLVHSRAGGVNGRIVPRDADHAPSLMCVMTHRQTYDRARMLDEKSISIHRQRGCVSYYRFVLMKIN